MKKEDLQVLEERLTSEVQRRRQLGGYSTEAEGISILAEALLKLTQHLIETYPKKK